MNDYNISNIRPNRLVTINENIILKKVDELKKHKINEVIEKIKSIIE